MTWIIVNKETREQWVANSGKSSWAKPGHAKNAWAHTMDDHRFGNELSRVGIQPKLEPTGYRDFRRLVNYKFDDQDKYELVEVVPVELKKSRAYKELLEECRNILGKFRSSVEIGSLCDRIDKVLEEQ